MYVKHESISKNICFGANLDVLFMQNCGKISPEFFIYFMASIQKMFSQKYRSSTSLFDTTPLPNTYYNHV